MISFAIVVPIVAASSLTAAFLVPLRDDRRGERATLRGFEPLRPLFAPTLATPEDTGERREPTRAERYRAMARDALMQLRAVLGFAPEPEIETAGGAFEAELQRVESLARDGAPTASISAAVDREREADVTAVTPIEFTPPVETMHPSLPRRDAVPPLTRARLRPARSCITWPTQLRIAHVGLNDTERHDLLFTLARDDGGENADALRIAYAEEDAAGRLLALKALARSKTDAARRLFSEAVVRGSDDERALSVDALATYGDHQSLHAALSDRIDAIAARAALAIVGTGDRSDYVRVLLPYVDATRLDRLLALLSAVLE